MTVRYVYWQEDRHWLAYLEEFPDYWTQGETIEDRKDHLRDLYEDLSHERIPEVRRTAELEVGWNDGNSFRPPLVLLSSFEAR